MGAHWQSRDVGEIGRYLTCKALQETHDVADILERAVAAIAIEPVKFGFVGKRTGIGVGVVIELIVRIEREVVRDEQVELAVIVRIEPNRADACAAAAGYTAGRRTGT